MRLAKLVLAALLVATPVLAQKDDDAPGAADPHAGGAHGGGGTMPDIFKPPPDTVDEDATLPPGSISIAILDADDKVVPHAQVTIGVLHNSVAKGESRSRTVRETDGEGMLRVDHQEMGNGIAYRVSVARSGAVFGAAPFQLPPARGVRVKLHVYEVTHKLEDALVAMQAGVYAELKDDRVQLQTGLQFFNFGRIAWVPDEIYIELPENFTALRAPEDMGDRGIDAVDKRGARLHGTFSPGQSAIEFNWQLPYDGDKEVTFDIGFPPNVAVARVMTQASQQMTLTVPGFPAAKPQVDRDGQHLLMTERQLPRDEPARLKVTLGNIPTQGPGRYIASSLAAMAILGGFGFAFTQRAPGKKRKQGDKAEQSQLLAELEELERLHLAADIGPKTYERARREIIDALARTLAKKPPR